MNNYLRTLNDLYDNTAHELSTLVKDSSDLVNEIKNVVVILTSSRAGSSLMKTVLAKSNELGYLSGEEEPYYILSRNTFPYAKSDKFVDIKDKSYLTNLIMSDMGLNINFIDVRRTTLDWQKRLRYQFPETKFSKDGISRNVEKYYGNSNNYEESTKLFIKNFVGEYFKGLYDVFSDERTMFLNDYKIEETPFVVPSQKRQYTIEDALNNVPILFKTPQDCYRIGIFEKMFPNANIKYIHLTRGFAQTVNGLMDGWLSDTGFFAHNMDSVDIKLNIKGYSDIKSYGKKWWKFDLPPNWKEFTDKSLEEVCLNQWMSAHQSILDSGVNVKQIKFEDFLISPQETIDDLCEYIGIESIKIGVLPNVMSTDTPGLYRWKKREDLIKNLAIRADVKVLMDKLNYSMDDKTWI